MKGEKKESKTTIRMCKSLTSTTELHKTKSLFLWLNDELKVKSKVAICCLIKAVKQ